VIAHISAMYTLIWETDIHNIFFTEEAFLCGSDKIGVQVALLVEYALVMGSLISIFKDCPGSEIEYHITTSTSGSVNDTELPPETANL
jgi:hypothetical protein